MCVCVCVCVCVCLLPALPCSLSQPPLLYVCVCVCMCVCDGTYISGVCVHVVQVCQVCGGAERGSGTGQDDSQVENSPPGGTQPIPGLLLQRGLV